VSEATALNLFPVKGMRRATANGAEIAALYARATGFEYHGIGDRELYAVAPSSEGDLMVLTPRGRTSPQGIEHRHVEDWALKRIGVDITGERQLRLSAEGIGAVALDLRESPSGKAVRAALHKGQVSGFDLGAEAGDFIGEITGRGGTLLMRIDRSAERMVGPGQLRSSLAADSQPYSLGNARSLAALSGLRRQAVPMLRYRPNIEVDNLGDVGPFSEDYARRIGIDGLSFRVAAGIVRCVVTNLDEEGEMVGRGLSTLAARKGRRVNSMGMAEEGRPEPIFCVSLNLEPGQEGQVSLHAPVTVLEWGSPNVRLAEG
jgi:uncharacterized protein YcbX